MQIFGPIRFLLNAAWVGPAVTRTKRTTTSTFGSILESFKCVCNIINLFVCDLREISRHILWMKNHFRSAMREEMK